METINFKTDITKTKNYSFFNFEVIDKDYEMFEDITIVVDWSVMINLKEYGIKDLTPIIKSISVEGTYSTIEDDNNKPYEKPFELILQDDINFTYVSPYDKEWKMENVEVNPSDYGTLEIEEVSLDFKDKTIQVEFNTYDNN
jgi:hypothetical protein